MSSHSLPTCALHEIVLNLALDLKKILVKYTEKACLRLRRRRFLAKRVVRIWFAEGVRGSLFIDVFVDRLPNFLGRWFLEALSALLALFCVLFRGFFASHDVSLLFEVRGCKVKAVVRLHARREVNKKKTCSPTSG